MDKVNNIEEYIDGNLSGKELKEFEQERISDPQLSEDIELSIEVNDALKDKNFIDLRQKLDNQIQTSMSPASVLSIQRDLFKTWHLAAASFALILVVGGLWYILSNKPFSTERLVTKYYKPAHPILQVRSIEINSDDAFKEAFNFYQQNDYKNALKYFNTLENQITAKFYSGICYIELEQFDKAISSFEYVINDKDNLFVEQAEWYMGLIFLMNNHKNEAVVQFENISKSDSYYAEQAKEILKYLN
ncbi:MAG: hypothetical protein K9G76_11295 [Bacteroidales bacterium]|nr:hypothetical protein [Bacteroidales bacterium]MCF8404979.1 hypothetical protein [Bacteroidales bacterium]